MTAKYMTGETDICPYSRPEPAAAPARTRPFRGLQSLHCLQKVVLIDALTRLLAARSVGGGGSARAQIIISMGGTGVPTQELI